MAELDIRIVTGGPLDVNTYVVGTEKGEECVVIDPGAEPARVAQAVSGRSVCAVLLTHGHFDHIWRAQELRNETGAPLYVHELDAEMLTDPRKNAYATFTGGSFAIEQAEYLLREGDEIELGNERLTVLHTPGHTRGSVCFDTGDSLITGDTIFAEGFGRYDLYGGSLSDLKSSLQRLMKLAESENRWIYCGHGNSSTLRQATELLKYYF